MSTITVWRDENDVIHALEVAGHANHGESGTDIVCAALSVLITTCANALEKLVDISTNASVDSYHLDNEARISVRIPQDVKGSRLHDARLIIGTVLQGFTDIAEEYPEHVQIIDRRISSC